LPELKLSIESAGINSPSLKTIEKSPLNGSPTEYSGFKLV